MPNASRATYIDDVVNRADLEAALAKIPEESRIVRRGKSVIVFFSRRTRARKEAPLSSRLPAPLARRLKDSDVWFGRDLTKPSGLSRAYERSRAQA